MARRGAETHFVSTKWMNEMDSWTGRQTDMEEYREAGRQTGGQSKLEGYSGERWDRRISSKIKIKG